MKKHFIKKVLLFVMVMACAELFAQTVLYENKSKKNSQTAITIEGKALENIRHSDYLSIKYKNEKGNVHSVTLASGKNAALMRGIAKGADNRKGVFTPEKKSGIFSYVLTQTDVSNIKKDGLVITAEGVNILKVYVENPPAPVIPEKKVEIPTEKFLAKPAPEFEEGTPFAEHGKLKVKGAYLYDKNDEKFMLYGMSTHGMTWFPTYVNKEGFKTLRDDWNTNCVRLALYPRENMGYCAGGNQAYLKKLVCSGIEAATELGMYVMVDWHVLNYNPNDLLQEAMVFFNEISQIYANYDNVIYELCNEPVGAKWETAIKPYAEKLIPVIRKNAPDSLIVCGTNTWSQELEGPLNDPLKIENVMYAFHFYADTHRDSFRSKVANCIESGLPVFITEFGTCNSSGNGGFTIPQSELWFELIEKYNISHMNWSLANKAETASVIRPDCSKVSDWDESELTESGKLIREHFKTLSR